MKKVSIYIILGLAIIAANSCTKSILKKVDVAGLSDPQVWTDSANAVYYVNALYNLVMPYWPVNTSSTTFPSSAHNTSDESNGGTATILQGTLTNDAITDFYVSGTGGSWFVMRKINTVFENIDAYGLTPSVTAPIKAQACFLRAWVYWDLIKLYGGIPYITNVEYLNDSTNLPRNSTSQCIDSLVKDLSYAAANLPAHWTGTEFGRITRDAALAFKARILLTWASPQFNPSGDAGRWQLANTAAKNAYDTCTMDGYALYSNFSRIFIDAGVATNHEPLLWRGFNGSTNTGQFEGYDAATRPYSQSNSLGGSTNNPTWGLVSAFPMADGRPITAASSDYPYDSVYYWKNRDPRFYATIVYNGAIYGLGGVGGRKQWIYQNITVDKSKASATGFYDRKNIDTTVTSANVQYGKTFWVEMRFAEVMMIYAETANLTGDQATAVSMLRQIRTRAGVKTGSNVDSAYGIYSNASQTDLETAILTEREIEFAFEGKRYDDLRRTRTFDKLNGTFRQQMIVYVKPPYKVSSTTANDPLALENTNSTGGNAFDTIDVNGPDYTKYFAHTIVPITGDKVIAFPTTYYAYGIPSSDISRETAMLQTVGWLWGSVPGTFDPTK